MLRMRFLIVLVLGFLVATAAWADEVGYVDCSNHSDPTQVFGKPRRTPDTVASLACGERFTILVYGFYFSRIQTKDGQIGYIYSSLIAVDRSATAVQQTPSLQSAADKNKIPSTRYTETSANSAPVQPPPAAHQLAPATPAGFPSPASVASASPTPAASTTLSTAPTTTSAQPTAAPTSAAETTPAAATQPDQPAVAQPTPAQPQPATAQPAPATTPEVTAAASASTPPEVPAPIAQPDPTTAAAQPEPESAPAPAQPAAQPAPIKPAPASIRPADTRETWEKTNPSVRTPPMLEFFGGFAYNRTAASSGYSSTSFNGALGSFGYNFKPWLQIVADTSYNFVTVAGTKTILYGNHYGPRYFFRRPNRFHLTPFAEAFIGGSRADVTPSGGVTSSQNSITYKIGGGVDYRASRRWEVRVVDFDYYRTAFGTDTHQNNYWFSTGVVLRLFGGSE
jgi:hypothetical protein